MVVAQNNELKFQRLLNITHYKEKVDMLNILYHDILNEGWCEWWNAQWNPKIFNTF
jgi:hypothetical protein